jgi:cyclophilin family peptidyl-prolyl cis-trans isomerase
MASRLGSSFVCTFLLLTLASDPAAGQVVRFETSIGEFDMVLNPTDNPVLGAHVDNMLEYVERNRYHSSWINRADTGFVLQMGGFHSNTKRPPLTIDSVRQVRAFGPVEGEPAEEISGLSNTVGTVSLALPGDGMGGTNQDAGTSSFFINLTDNSFLDQDFTVFAAIPDMTVINQIMALTKIDRTTDPLFGAGPNNLAFTDVPLREGGFQVFIERAFVVEDAMSIARAMAAVQPVMAASASSGDAGGAAAPLSSIVVPEPATLLTAAMGSAIALLARRRRRRIYLGP